MRTVLSCMLLALSLCTLGGSSIPASHLATSFVTPYVSPDCPIRQFRLFGSRGHRHGFPSVASPRRRGEICCNAGMQEAQKVVVCGAGVIGSTLAYYLTLRGVKPVIVDRKSPPFSPEQALESGSQHTMLACGGFLPSNWLQNSFLEQLAGLSFSLHEELATKFPDTG
eukprot:3073184-Rhodomonas_salina.2